MERKMRYTRVFCQSPSATWRPLALENFGGLKGVGGDLSSLVNLALAQFVNGLREKGHAEILEAHAPKSRLEPRSGEVWQKGADINMVSPGFRRAAKEVSIKTVLCPPTIRGSPCIRICSRLHSRKS